MPGAQINALQQNSYVALVAPRIEQGGTVKVDGSAAYVAANSLTMTMNQGLFDIQVDVGGGTGNSNGIVHTGTTTGGNTASLSGNHRIYMVAVPKNQALTMLLGGTAGFDANVAGYDNGQIVLWAGWSLADTGAGFNPSSETTVDANIDIDTGTYLSDLFAIARGDIQAIADTGNIAFAGDVNLNTYDAGSTGNVTLGATNNDSLTVAGNVSMLTSNPTFFSEALITADGGGTVDISGNATLVAGRAEGSGGSAAITAGGSLSGGTINIGGVADLNVDGRFGSAVTPASVAGDAAGGSINVTAYNNGTITTGRMELNANAYGQDSTGSGGGDGDGGNVYVNADGGGSITVNGNLAARAQGSGGAAAGTGISGGIGDGGYVQMSAGNGSIDVTGNAVLSTSAWGGSVTDGNSSAVGGEAYGGYTRMTSDGPGSIRIGGTTDVRAEARGGNGQAGGNAYGGTAGISATDGSINLGGATYISAQGFGGNANIGFGGLGGDGQGGTVSIEARANPIVENFSPTAGTITGGDAVVDASGTGGSGGAGDGSNVLAGTGGNGDGGVANVFAHADGASLTLGNVSVLSDGLGGIGGTGATGQAGGTGGIGYGGISQVALMDPFQTTAPTGSMSFGGLEVRARGVGGTGGNGGSGGNGGTGGDGFGGYGSLDLATGSFAASDVGLNANGSGGLGGGGTTGGLGELGYSWDEVHDEAEVLEHAVSDRMLDRIDAKLGFPTRDPHGDPIPAADGQVPTPDARQLSVCVDGETGVVARISDADPEMLRYFDSVGISLDSRLRVLARRDFAGMISVAVENVAAPDDASVTTVDWVALQHKRSG